MRKIHTMCSLFFVVYAATVMGLSLPGEVFCQQSSDVRAEALERVDRIRHVCSEETSLETIMARTGQEGLDLIGMGESVTPILLSLLSDSGEDWQLRFVLTGILPNISKSNEVAEVLASALKDRNENPYLRGACAHSLGYVGRKEYVSVLIEMLKEQSVYVKERTIWALDMLRDPRTIRPLIESMDDSYYMVQVLAIQTLGHMGAKEAIEPLRKKLGSDDLPQYPGIIKHKIVQAISDIGGPEARSILLNILGDKSYAELRLGAADGLGGFKDDQVVLQLMKTLHDGDELLRLHAAQALTTIGDERAKDAIRRCVENTESEYVRSMLGKLIEKK